MTPFSFSHLYIKPPPLFFPFPPLCSGWGYSFPYWYYPEIAFLSRSFHAASSHSERGVQNVHIMVEMGHACYIYRTSTGVPSDNGATLAGVLSSDSINGRWL